MKEIHGGNLVGRGGAGLLVDVGGREDGAPVVKDLVWIPDEEKVRFSRQKCHDCSERW